MAATYEPQNVAFLFNGIEVVGFGPDESINCEYNEDAFTRVTGNDGTVARAKNPDRSGTITLTLLSTSPSNDVLSGFEIRDNLDGSGVGAVLIKDHSGRSLASAKDCWIRKAPAMIFGREVPTRAWVLEAGTLTIFHGGTPES